MPTDQDARDTLEEATLLIGDARADLAYDDQYDDRLKEISEEIEEIYVELGDDSED